VLTLRGPRVRATRVIGSGSQIITCWGYYVGNFSCILTLGQRKPHQTEAYFSTGVLSGDMKSGEPSDDGDRKKYGGDAGGVCKGDRKLEEVSPSGEAGKATPNPSRKSIPGMRIWVGCDSDG